MAADLDEDGRVDLFVANDMTANYFFQNQGQFRFAETGLAAGVAGNASGGFQAGMGVACGDLDGDGRFDLAVTNYYNESTSFFRNLGQGFFGDQSAAIGLATPSRYVLGFGIAFLDADNDGWLDLMTANGHVYDGSPQFPWKMPVQLYHNQGGERPFLTDVSAQPEAPFQTLRIGRGLAAGDLDNDGRVDALVVSQNEPLAYFHNRSQAGHFLTLRLEGRTVQPRCRRRSGDGPLRRASHGRAASGRRQLSVRERPKAPFRPRLIDPGRGGRGALAFGAGGSLRRAQSRYRVPYPRGRVAALAPCRLGRIPLIAETPCRSQKRSLKRGSHHARLNL